MKRLLAVTPLLAAAVICIGCSHKTAKTPLFHVTEVHPCDDNVEVVGIFQGNEYALTINRERPHVPLYVACSERIVTADVGKDFRATLNNDDTIDINVPGWNDPVTTYNIQASRAK